MTYPSSPRFYGRRKGRTLSPRQKTLLTTLLPSLSVGANKLSVEEIVKKSCDLNLEIGFGQGEHLAALAQMHPERTYLGCEAFITGIVHLISMVEAEGLKNIHLFPDDARLLIPHLPVHQFNRIYILFADPWPKERHHKRRLLTPEFLRTMGTLLKKPHPLKEEGRLFLASDHPGYREAILEALSTIPEFRWDVGFPLTCTQEERQGLLQDPTSLLPQKEWPLTRYEEKALRSGASCLYIKGYFLEPPLQNEK